MDLSQFENTAKKPPARASSPAGGERSRLTPTAEKKPPARAMTAGGKLPERYYRKLVCK